MDAEDAGHAPDLGARTVQLPARNHADTVCGAATVLNISDDHLDRYAGLDAYAGAKTAIFLR
jgi:UDP-N-acetylmuramoylalanine--D-glutamate ligase